MEKKDKPAKDEHIDGLARVLESRLKDVVKKYKPVYCSLWASETIEYLQSSFDKYLQKMATILIDMGSEDERLVGITREGKLNELIITVSGFVSKMLLNYKYVTQRMNEAAKFYKEKPQRTTYSGFYNPDENRIDRKGLHQILRDSGWVPKK